MAIKQSDQKLSLFRTGTLVWSGETSASPCCNSTSTPRKPASGNSCKNLMAIKRSDQKLWPFRTGSLVWSYETSASATSDSTSTPRKPASGNSCKNLMAIKSYGPFEPVLWSGATRLPLHRQAIPYLLHKTCVRKLQLKFYGDQTVGSKVIDLSNRYSGLERRELRFTELLFHIYSTETCVRKLL